MVASVTSTRPLMHGSYHGSSANSAIAEGGQSPSCIGYLLTITTSHSRLMSRSVRGNKLRITTDQPTLHRPPSGGAWPLESRSVLRERNRTKE